MLSRFNCRDIARQAIQRGYQLWAGLAVQPPKPGVTGAIRAMVAPRFPRFSVRSPFWSPTAQPAGVHFHALWPIALPDFPLHRTGISRRRAAERVPLILEA